MDIIQKIKEELQVEKWQVEAAVKLIDEGNTIPFISRYRKEATGSLNDEQLRNLDERLTYLRSLEDKKEQVLKSIEEQGKLTDELKEKELKLNLAIKENGCRPAWMHAVQVLLRHKVKAEIQFISQSLHDAFCIEEINWYCLGLEIFFRH